MVNQSKEENLGMSHYFLWCSEDSRVNCHDGGLYNGHPHIKIQGLIKAVDIQRCARAPQNQTRSSFKKK